MGFVVRGLLNKQICGHLGTSEATVKIQRAQMMQKMHAESVPELVHMSEILRLVAGSQIAPPSQSHRI